MSAAKSLKAQELLPPCAELSADRVDVSSDADSVEAAGCFSAACPGCGARSTSRHSHYRRKLQDLPIQGKPVMLHLQLVDGAVAMLDALARYLSSALHGWPLHTRWARRTNRLRELVAMAGHGMGGRPGVRLMHQLGTPGSDDTLLRSVKRVQCDQPPGSLRVVGGMTGPGRRDRPSAPSWLI
jgi:hypothetical protein